MRRFAIRVAAAVLALALITMGAEGVTQSAAAQTGTPAVCTATGAENEATARRWFEEAINGADLSVIDEIVLADAIHHAGTFPDGEGPDAIEAVLGALLAGFPNTRHTVEQVIVHDDMVVVRWQAEGTHAGDFQGYAATGKTVTWTGINIFRMECGRIAESWSEIDGLGRLMQLGVWGTPTP
jgi:predicted ester cyclase